MPRGRVSCETGPEEGKKVSRGKAIKAYCRECAGGSYLEVLVCHLFDCPLWPYRTGYSANVNKKSLKIALGKHPDIAVSAPFLRPQVPKPTLGRRKSVGTDETTDREA